MFEILSKADDYDYSYVPHKFQESKRSISIIPKEYSLFEFVLSNDSGFAKLFKELTSVNIALIAIGILSMKNM